MELYSNHAEESEARKTSELDGPYPTVSLATPIFTSVDLCPCGPVTRPFYLCLRLVGGLLDAALCPVRRASTFSSSPLSPAGLFPPFVGHCSGFGSHSDYKEVKSGHGQ